VSNKGIMTGAFAFDQANGLDGHLYQQTKKKKDKQGVGGICHLTYALDLLHFIFCSFL
jgi:hypothetical protein